MHGLVPYNTHTSGYLDFSDSWFLPDAGFAMAGGTGGGAVKGCGTEWPLDTCFISGAPATNASNYNNKYCQTNTSSLSDIIKQLTKELLN